MAIRSGRRVARQRLTLSCVTVRLEGSSQNAHSPSVSAATVVAASAGRQIPRLSRTWTSGPTADSGVWLDGACYGQSQPAFNLAPCCRDMASTRAIARGGDACVPLLMHHDSVYAHDSVSACPRRPVASNGIES